MAESQLETKGHATGGKRMVVVSAWRVGWWHGREDARKQNDVWERSWDGENISREKL